MTQPINSLQEWRRIKFVGWAITLVGLGIILLGQFLRRHILASIISGIILICVGLSIVGYADYQYKKELTAYYNAFPADFWNVDVVKKPINLKAKVIGKIPYKYKSENGKLYEVYQEDGYNRVAEVQ